MSGCNVVIKLSAWRRYGLLALAAMLFGLFCIQPLPLLTIGLAAPLLCWLYWYGLMLYWQEPVAKGLAVQADGQLRWWQSGQPAGCLVAGCLVSEFGLLVRWQSQDDSVHQHQHQHQQWLLADQLSREDYRALARQLNQFNWQQSVSGKPVVK